MKIPCKDCILFAQCKSNNIDKRDDVYLLSIEIYNCELILEMYYSLDGAECITFAIDILDLFECERLDLFECERHNI